MEHFNMYIPTRVIFGIGELNNLHKQAMPDRRALVVISNGRSTRANGYLDRLEEQLKLTGISYAVFDKVEANPLAGTVMAGGRTARENGCDMIVALGGGSVTSQHSLEHTMSAYHQELPHGVGLVMISRAYFSHMIEVHVCDERFVRMAWAMGMADAAKPGDFIKALGKLQDTCGVADLKMSDYGINMEEAAAFACNARETMGRLFQLDRIQISGEDCIRIYEKSYN